MLSHDFCCCCNAIGFWFFCWKNEIARTYAHMHIYIYICVCVYIMPYRLENCRSVGSGCSFCRNSEYRLSKAPFCSVVAFRKAFVSSARTDIWCVEPAVLVKIPTGCLISNKYNWT